MQDEFYPQEAQWDVVFCIACAALAPSVLVIGPFPSGGRTSTPTDPVAYEIVTGKFRAPKAGDKVGNRTWKSASTREDGSFQDAAFQGGYAYASFESARDGVMLLDAQGDSMVYVNGVPRGGDPYSYGFVQLPLPVHKGRNELLFAVGRGQLKYSLTETTPAVTVRRGDPTLPDLIVGEDTQADCGILLMNSTSERFEGTLSGAVLEKESKLCRVQVPPMTVRKVVLSLPRVSPNSPGPQTLKVDLKDNRGRLLSTENFTVDCKLPNQVHKRTFRSSVDGSVQYYAVQPASAPGARAMVLSLHGAGVEASGQAAAYGAKPWCTIICPTNGRPFGFDWEDWGRTNALDALADAKKVYQPAEDRVYLTGHSMGGHGAWSIGFNRPDLFGAIAPCAGWISFWSYAGGASWKESGPVEQILRRSLNPSDTLLLLDNAKSFGVYIQHGDKDDNVPVEQAREMRRRLGEFHHDFDWHEEPGQGHWFDTDPEPGANVQDYAPLFDFLARHRIPSEDDRRIWSLTSVDLVTANRCRNVQMVAQKQRALPSKVTVRTYAAGDFEEVTTENLSAVDIALRPGGPRLSVKIDGQEFMVDQSDSGPLHLVKGERGWTGVAAPTQLPTKRFKQCYNGVLAFDGPSKSCETNWAYTKARFDAETWWVRGNGSFDVLPSAAAHGAGVTYHNPPSKPGLRFFPELLKIAANPGKLEFNGHKFDGSTGYVLTDGNAGHVGGTSQQGCRATERLGFFTSGVHFPDIFVFAPEMYASGSKGVVAAGLLGPGMGWEGSETATREEKLGQTFLAK